MRRLLAAVAIALLAGVSAPASAQTLVILKSAAEATRFDPHKDQTHASGEVVTLLTDSLVSLDADLKTVRPGLATSWNISTDGKTYVFPLRKDVTYCNGRPMRAKDVVGSLERWRNPATRSNTAFRIASVEGVHALDDYTVEIKLFHPDNELLLELSTHFAGIIDPVQAAELKDDFGVTAFNGVGPFCLEKWSPRQEVVLRRNEAYRWGPPQFANKGPAKVQRIVLRSVPEESTLAATLASGSGMLTSAVADWAKPKMRSSPNIAASASKSVGFSPTLWLRTNKAPLNDAQLRRALALAIDRPQLAKAVWGPAAEPAWTFSAPGVRDADPSLDKLAPQFDVSAAAKLLDSLGWKVAQDGIRQKDGKRLSLLVYGQDLPQWRNALGAIHGMWRAAGVDLQLRLWEPQVAFSKLSNPEWDLALFNNIYISTGDSLDAAFLSKNIGTSNRVGWNDLDTDHLLMLAAEATTDTVRQKLYDEVQTKLLAATPAIPLYNDERTIFYNKSQVKGVKAFGMYGVMLYKALDVEVTR